MRPTFYGFVYLGMTLALLLGSINHNTNLGYLLTFLLGGLLLVSARETLLAVRGLEAGPCAAEPAFAGTTALARLSLRAETPVYEQCYDSILTGLADCLPAECFGGALTE